jgi:glycosyltransferase involved in cell wall biosynthesis
MAKLIRITTIPLSLEKLLEGQLTFMSNYYEVTAVSAEKERLEKYGKENKVNTFCVGMTRAITPLLDTKALFKLYSFFKREKPLIVHTHTPKAGIIGMLAAKMAGVPIRLHTVAGMPLMEATGVRRRVLNQVEKLTYSCATKVYPNSEGLKKIILQEKFTSEDKLKVLGNGSSNGIDTNYFDPEYLNPTEKSELKEKLQIPENDLVFVFVGRLVADKGMNELVEAFEMLQKTKPDISLLLVGPFEQELDPISEKTLDAINDHQKIFTVGYQEDVRPYFSISDVLVFPSYREGFPNVVMQAGAMGLPSIVTNINGCNEIIEEGVNGTIIPVKDKSTLQGAMEKMVTDTSWREKLEINARKNMTANYERDIFWKLLLEEYRLQEKLLH